MKAMPTLQGGLRIDTEDPDDWGLLQCIIEDAKGPGPDLAARLGGLMGDEAAGEDWREYVVPDLRDGFHDALNRVNDSIEAAIANAKGEAGPLWITPEDAYPWYSSLNQARLAIEEHFHFGPGELPDLHGMSPEGQSAFIRSRFYCAIQSLLLEYVMR